MKVWLKLPVNLATLISSECYSMLLPSRWEKWVYPFSKKSHTRFFFPEKKQQRASSQSHLQNLLASPIHHHIMQLLANTNSSLATSIRRQPQQSGHVWLQMCDNEESAVQVWIKLEMSPNDFHYSPDWSCIAERGSIYWTSIGISFRDKRTFGVVVYLAHWWMGYQCGRHNWVMKLFARSVIYIKGSLFPIWECN